jgi:sulfite exporter TauE/SafE
MKINYYRMLGYAEIAIGLINLTYQSGESAIFAKSIFAIFLGALLISLTFLLKSTSYFENKTTAYFWGAVAVLITFISIL